MAVVKPFRGLRPPREIARDLACLPYDVMKEAREKRAAREKAIGTIAETK